MTEARTRPATQAPTAPSRRGWLLNPADAASVPASQRVEPQPRKPRSMRRPACSPPDTG